MADEERSWGEFFTNVRDAVVDDLAQIPVVGSALQVAVNTPRYQDEQAIREARRQKLANDMALSNLSVQQAQQELTNAQMRGKNLLLDNGAKQFAADHREEDYADQKRLFAENFKEAQSKANVAQSGANIAQMNFVNAQRAQDDAFIANSGRKFRTGLESIAGYSTWDMVNQERFNQSPAVKEAQDAFAVTSAYQEYGAESGQRIASRLGFKIETGEDGKVSLVSPSGVRIDDANVASVLQSVSDNLKNEIEALQATSGDSATLSQYAAKNVIQSAAPLFGGEGNAWGAYKNLVSSMENGSPRYSAIERGGHLLNVSLTAALQDQRITPQEMKVLAPQLDELCKKLGATLIPNNEDLTLSRIKLASGEDIPLYDQNMNNRSFLTDLRSRDRIMEDWKMLQQSRAAQIAKEHGKQDGVDEAERDKNMKKADNDLSKEYDYKYLTLGDEEKEALQKAHVYQQVQTKFEMERYKAKNMSELPEEALLKLEDGWNTLVANTGLKAADYEYPDKPLLLAKQYERHNNALERYDKEMKELEEEAEKTIPDFKGKLSRVENARDVYRNASMYAHSVPTAGGAYDYEGRAASEYGEDFKNFYTRYKALKEKIRISKEALQKRKEWLADRGYDIEKIKSSEAK